MFGVTRENITAICTGRSWKHLGGPITKESRGSKLTTQQKILIKNLRAEGNTYQDIADILDISTSTAYKYGSKP